MKRFHNTHYHHCFINPDPLWVHSSSASQSGSDFSFLIGVQWPLEDSSFNRLVTINHILRNIFNPFYMRGLGTSTRAWLRPFYALGGRAYCTMRLKNQIGENCRVLTMITLLNNKKKHPICYRGQDKYLKFLLKI